MAKRGKLHVGTSGWDYNHWQPGFYPDELPRSARLGYYVDNFDSVEINNAFYHLPGLATLKQWKHTVPAGFSFAVKASRYITHMKRLKEPGQAVQKFFRRMRLLGGALGPILFQLPPRWRVNVERLQAFLDALPGGNRYAFEFRDESWFCSPVYEALAAHGAACCIYHLNRRTSPKKVTADFVYIRLHGPGQAYQGEYKAKGLSGWAGAVTSWRERGNDVYSYFDNDQDGYAPRDARRLLDMVGG